jgi:hypothetical protein
MQAVVLNVVPENPGLLPRPMAMTTTEVRNLAPFCERMTIAGYSRQNLWNSVFKKVPGVWTLHALDPETRRYLAVRIDPAEVIPVKDEDLVSLTAQLNYHKARVASLTNQVAKLSLSGGGWS